MRRFIIATLMLLALVIPATVCAESNPVIQEDIVNDSGYYEHTLTLPVNMKLDIKGLGEGITDRSGFSYNYMSDEEGEEVTVTNSSPDFILQACTGDSATGVHNGTLLQDTSGVMYCLLATDSSNKDGVKHMSFACVPFKTIKYDGKLVIDATQNAGLDEVFTLNGTIELTDKVSYDSNNFHIKDGKGTFTVKSNQKITLSGLYRDATYNLSVTKPSDTDTYTVKGVNISPESGTVGASSTAEVKMNVEEVSGGSDDPTPGKEDSDEGSYVETDQDVWAKALPVKSGKVKVSWSKPKDADYYVVYGSVKGKSMKQLKKTTSTSYTHKVKKDKTYQYKVVAYSNFKHTKVGTSKKILSLGKKYNKKYSMVKSIKVTPSGNITLSVGQTKTLKIKQVQYKKKKNPFAKGVIHYYWDNAEVITINNYTIKAMSKGKSNVDICTANGIHKRITVTVR